MRRTSPTARWLHMVRAGFLPLVALLLAGCAQLVPQTIGLRTEWPAGVPRTVEIAQVPFFPDSDVLCGPATLATVLAHGGAPASIEQLAKEVYTPGRQGSLQLEMLAAPRRYARVSYLLAPRYADMLREVAAGNPVVVLQDIGPMFTQWHYAVVNGFDYPSGTIYLRSGTEKRREMPFTAFERDWMKGGYWAMVVVPPDRIPATATEHGWIQAVNAMARVAPPDATRTAYDTALRRWPDNLPAAIGLANHHHARGDHATAVSTLREAQRRHPQSVIVINNLAQALSDLGRHAEALSQIDKANDPQSPFAAEVRSTRQLILQRIEQQRTGNRR